MEHTLSKTKKRITGILKIPKDKLRVRTDFSTGTDAMSSFISTRRNAKVNIKVEPTTHLM